MKAARKPTFQDNDCLTSLCLVESSIQRLQHADRRFPSSMTILLIWSERE